MAHLILVGVGLGLPGSLEFRSLRVEHAARYVMTLAECPPQPEKVVGNWRTELQTVQVEPRFDSIKVSPLAGDSQPLFSILIPYAARTARLSY